MMGAGKAEPPLLVEVLSTAGFVLVIGAGNELLLVPVVEKDSSLGVVITGEP